MNTQAQSPPVPHRMVQRSKNVKPTRCQQALLKTLNKPGRYVRDRFDGSLELYEADGDRPSEGSANLYPHGNVVKACFRRGWIAYTIHHWGEGEVEIERRYHLTPSGRIVSE